METNNVAEENIITTQEEAVAESVQAMNEQEKESGKSGIKKWIFIGAAIVLGLLAAVLLGIYNSPENRVSRQLDLGQKYLEEQNYEEAVVAFNQAIEIDDRCLEAYVGGIEAYKHLGDADELEDFYEKALEASQSLDGDILEENMDYVKDIYLAATDVYSGDLNKTVEILEEGLEVTEDNDVKQALVDSYLVIGKQHTDSRDYVSALEVYDRVLELDEQNNQLVKDLSKCVFSYIEELIAQKRFDEAEAVIAKYRGYSLNVDFDAFLARIAELRAREAENTVFMEQVYALMSAEDYEGMMELDGSEEANAFVSRMSDMQYVYIPDDKSGMNGIGVGVYRYEDPEGESEMPYYFFYGDYQGGIRVGNGKSFQENGEATGYTLFNGAWQNDAPNGYGEESTSVDYFKNNGETFSSEAKGNLINGLWDGKCERFVYDDGKTYDVSFSAVNGVPTEDKTSAFLAEKPHGYDGVEENEYVIAYDFNNRSWVCTEAGYNRTYGTIGYGGYIE